MSGEIQLFRIDGGTVAVNAQAYGLRDAALELLVWVGIDVKGRRVALGDHADIGLVDLGFNADA